MQILYFNRSFYPDIEATGQLMTDLCEMLIKKDHEITVVAGQSYYSDNHDKSSFIQRQNYKSIEIIRGIGSTFSKRFLFLRIINLWCYFFNAFLEGFLIKKTPDLIIVGTDPPVLGLIGIFFSKWYKAKFIYYCQDIYPDVGIATGKLTNPILNFLLNQINIMSFKMADRIICIGDYMKNRIISKGINENKITIVYNWADTSTLYSVLKDENPFIAKYNLKNYFTVMYSGNIGLTQNLEKIIEVAKHFKANPKVKFLLVGEGASKVSLQKLVTKYELLNMEFLPYQQKEQLKYSLSAPDIHLIPFEKGLSGIMVPSKVYNILACGKPYIGWIERNSEINSIASKFKCGITVPPGDIRNMIRAINWAIKHPDELKEMGLRGREAVVKYFDINISVDKFNKAICELLP